MIINSIGVAELDLRTLDDGVLGVDPIKLKVLRQDGYHQYRTTESGLADLAAESIRACLALSEINSTSVDGAVVVTESFWAQGDATAVPGLHTLREALAHVMTTELPNAVCYGSWLSGCANLISSLALVDALIRSGRHTNIMIIFADKVIPGACRAADSSIFSDVGVGCLFGATGSWVVSNILSVTSPGQVSARLQKSVLLQGRALMGSLKDLARRIEQETGLRMDAFDMIISDNLGRVSVDLAACSLGVPPEKILVPTRASHGHCFSSDCLLSLIPASKLVHAGQQILLVNIGPWSHGAAVVRRR